MKIALDLPDDLIRAIAERAARLVADEHSHQGRLSPYLTVAEATEYMRTDPQRVYDLCSSGRLKRFKDGSRLLLSRAEIDAHLAEGRRSPIAPPLPPTPRSRSGKGIAA